MKGIEKYSKHCKCYSHDTPQDMYDTRMDHDTNYDIKFTTVVQTAKLPSHRTAHTHILKFTHNYRYDNAIIT